MRNILQKILQRHSRKIRVLFHDSKNKIILVILELSCGIAAYVKRDNVTKILDDTALSSIEKEWGIKVVIDGDDYSFGKFK